MSTTQFAASCEQTGHNDGRKYVRNIYNYIFHILCLYVCKTWKSRQLEIFVTQVAIHWISLKISLWHSTVRTYHSKGPCKPGVTEIEQGTSDSGLG